MTEESDPISGNRPAPCDTPTRTEDLYCPVCSYNLHGLTGQRCPECGLPLADIRALGSSIPWVHRGAIGSWRAYRRTARRVTFRGKRFFREVPELVHYSAAQRFRWITVAVVAFTALLIYGSYAVSNPNVVDDLILNGWYRGLQLVAGIVALAAMTGVPSYLFHPRQLSIGEQNRAIAMSCYACAPLAFVSWTLPLYALATLIAVTSRDQFDSPPWLALAVTALAALIWWRRLIRLGRTALRRRWHRIRIALCVPLLWLLVAGLIFAGIPWLVLYAVTLVFALA